MQESMPMFNIPMDIQNSSKRYDIDSDNMSSSSNSDSEAALLASKSEFGMSKRPRTVCTNILDFANIFKAFIGSGYLGMPFAVQQSGIALGIIGCAIIAFLTDHCCFLIIKCKREAVRIMLTDESEDPELVHKVEKGISFEDVGFMSFGIVGHTLVTLFVSITQFGFCVSYLVFIGSTLPTYFPVVAVRTNLTTAEPILSETFNSSPSLRENLNFTILESVSSLPEMIDTATKPTITAFEWKFVPGAPPFYVLVLFPLPILLLAVIIRDIRGFGPISITANCALILAYFLIVFYMVGSLHTLPVIEHFKWATFPVFFGQVTGMMEGIGMVIPIESGMSGNRQRFPLFLHINIFILGCLLMLIGTVGYLAFSPNVEQIILQNLPAELWLKTVIGSFLLVAILLTYPLQLYPLVEILESFLFAPGRWFGPAYDADVDDLAKALLQEDVFESDSARKTDLTSVNGAPSRSRTRKSTTTSMVIEIPHSVAAWKRNTVRVTIVMLTVIFAILGRNNFSYIFAFNGALGSTILAFVLPCLFHLKLCSGSMSTCEKLKDILLVVFGITASVVSLSIVVQEIIFSNSSI